VKNYEELISETDWNALRGTGQKNSSSFVSFVQNLKINTAVAFVNLSVTSEDHTKGCCQ